MKKSLIVSLSILVSILLVVGLFIMMYFLIFKDESNIKSFELTTNNIILEVGDSKNLNDCYNVAPLNASLYVMCYINDATFAEISNKNVITAKTVGNTIIVVKCKVNNKMVEKEISLSVIEKKVIPSNFSFEFESITVGLNSIIFNKIVCNETFNVVPTIDYSNSNICEYNYITGKITPLNLGSTTVTVKFELGGTTISKSFDVNIENNYRTIETNLTKEGDYYILTFDKSSFGMFTIKVYEMGVETSNVKVVLEFITNEAGVYNLQAESNSPVLKATSNGESILKTYCENDESVFILIKVRVE